jgi:hypothetical protein
LPNLQAHLYAMSVDTSRWTPTCLLPRCPSLMRKRRGDTPKVHLVLIHRASVWITLSAADHSLAYFDESLEGSFGILHRPWFEQQLAAHLAGLICDPDPTWHALRNLVFATGCRIEMCKSNSFREAAKRAWRYFENALSVYARLLFFKTSIVGVQVLTLMVSIAQNS